MGEPLATLTGHEEKVNKVQFHPRCPQYLLSTSNDGTWRLWDVERGTSILEQEGACGAVYALSVHCDGSLVATGDSQGHVRLSDLRTGRALLPLTSHVKQCLCADLAPTGNLLATGSEDNTVKLWDLRKRVLMTTVLAHTKLVSVVKWEPIASRFLMSASYDTTVKIWSGH